MAKKDNFPLSEARFQGAGGVTPDQPQALQKLLNDLAADANLVQNASAGTVAVAGGDTPSIEIDGVDWSDAAADWLVKIGKYEATVDSVAQAGGVTTITLASTPALTDYSATEPIVVTVLGKIPGRSGWLAAGSLQLAGA